MREKTRRTKAKRKENKRTNGTETRKSKSKKSFILGGLAAAATAIAFIITYAVRHETIWLYLAPATAYCVLSFIVQLFIPDSPAYDILDFFTKSFRMPGVIFSLSFEGIISFICIKLVLGIISGILSLFVFLIGVAISFIVSAFAFPFVMAKYFNNYKNV